MESIASSRREYLDQYKDLQTSLVEKIVDTARTYLPVFEAASNLVAEIDVLTAFATAAALSPGDYCRPKVHPLGSGILNYVVSIFIFYFIVKNDIYFMLTFSFYLQLFLKILLTFLVILLFIIIIIPFRMLAIHVSK